MEEDWEKRIIESFRHRDFRREMYGEWLTETEQERKLRELAEVYHARTEAYDRSVCSGTSPRTGNAIPVTPEQRRAIESYARDQRDTAMVEGHFLGFTSRQVEEAIRKWVK